MLLVRRRIPEATDARAGPSVLSKRVGRFMSKVEIPLNERLRGDEGKDADVLYVADLFNCVLPLESRREAMDCELTPPTE